MNKEKRKFSKYSTHTNRLGHYAAAERQRVWGQWKSYWERSIITPQGRPVVVSGCECIFMHSIGLHVLHTRIE